MSSMIPYAAVVGGVNIDIGGRSFAPLVVRDSNPGHVSVSLGGVGRNIAHNLRLLGIPVHFLTAFGDDFHASRIESSCAKLGIDISHARKVPGASTSTYVFLNDADGDMVLAVSDMAICDEITPVYLSENLPLLNRSAAVVADCNLSAESLCTLTENCTSPIFADPVSVTKAGKLKSVLGKVHTLKPNRLEAELLSGVKISDEPSMNRAAERLLSTGLKRVFLSLGSDGVFAMDGKERIRMPGLPASVQNTTGAGDAFMASLVWSWIKGMDLHDTTLFASAAAAIATESNETINSALSEHSLRGRVKNISERSGFSIYV